MRIIVAAVGRLKAGAERQLAERYRDRAAKAGRALGHPRHRHHRGEGQSRPRNAERRILEEAIALRSVIPDGAVTVALDARGENLSSESLAGASAGLERRRPRQPPSSPSAAPTASARRSARAGRSHPRLRPLDLAPPTRANHAAGADLPGLHDSSRDTLTIGSDRCWRPELREPFGGEDRLTLGNPENRRLADRSAAAHGVMLPHLLLRAD